MTDEVLRVGVIGARGRMGTEVCRVVDAAADMDLVATVGQDEWLFSLADAGSQVVVDFTHPDVVMEHIRFCIDQGIDCVVGTSGVDDDRLATIRHWLELKPDVGVIVVPNFAIGAVLAARFAREAARFFDLRRDHRTAPRGEGRCAVGHSHRLRRRDRRRSRGGRTRDGSRTRRNGRPMGPAVPSSTGSTCIPCGCPAWLRTKRSCFGNDGETLTIRHDSTSRSSFMPGVLAAIRAVGSRPGLTVGLENLLGLG